MATELTRRGFLTTVGAAGVLAAAGCSSSKPAAGNPSGGAVTIKHVFGETTIQAPPTRVVSAGFTEQDSLLALGIVPIAITEWFGAQPFAVWPWAQPKLGPAQPVVLNHDNGFAIDQIAGLKPDLIVAINAGVDAESYQKLSAIAPTVAQSGGDAYFEPWKDQATTIGMATFQHDTMQSLIKSVDDGFAAAGTANPQFKGKKAVLLEGTLWQNSIVATMPGWRTDFLTQLGFTVPDSLRPYQRDHRAFIPPDRAASALDEADVLIWSTESDADHAALLADPNIAVLRATKLGRNVFTTSDLAGAIAFSSVLSYPFVASQLPPLLTNALN